jgi:hypothetical protein
MLAFALLSMALVQSPPPLVGTPDGPAPSSPPATSPPKGPAPVSPEELRNRERGRVVLGSLSAASLLAAGALWRESQQAASRAQAGALLSSSELAFQVDRSRSFSIAAIVMLGVAAAFAVGTLIAFILDFR